MEKNNVLIRPVRENDLISLCDIASKVDGSLPSLLNDRKFLANKINRSMESFAQINEEQARIFFFVLEDLEEERIIGTSAIEAQVAYHGPYYTYYVTTLIQKYRSLDLHQENAITQPNKILYLSNDYQDSSLLCTLFINPANRSLGEGSLLSRTRLLFIAEFPDFFSNRIIAEMRGVYDQNMEFPFWDSVGQRFYNMDIIEAEKILAIEGTHIVTELNPRLPIYVPLLPLATQKIIGEVNVNTKPALHTLGKEGFFFQNHIDVFDGGPILEARKKDIRTVKTSQVAIIVGFLPPVSKDESKDFLYIVCNAKLNFRATLAKVQWHKEEGVFLEKSIVQLLELSIGDKIRLCAFR